MNVKRFTAKTSREALALVRQALGDDAVVLSTRPGHDGVEVLAMAPDGMAQIEQAASLTAVLRAPPRVSVAKAQTAHSPLAQRIAARGERLEPVQDAPVSASSTSAAMAGADLAEPSVDSDVQALGMSTLTFQDYVRERMLRRRQVELAQADTARHSVSARAAAISPGAVPLRAVPRAGRPAGNGGALLDDGAPRPLIRPTVFPNSSVRNEPPVLRDEIALADFRHVRAGMGLPGRADSRAEPRSATAGGSHDVMGELRSVRHLIEERFGMLAFMEKLQRDPRQAALSQKLFDVGLSPALVRKLVQALPIQAANGRDGSDGGDGSAAIAWAAGVLQRNVHTDEHEAPIEDHAGVLALVGPTGVGKTTSTAKIAAAFAARHGAGNLGLITLDAYRIAAHEQLRTYGRILGVPVHTAHDRASLEDLLDLLKGKRLVLIDTAGIAQRDSRAAELLDMLSHPAIQKLLVVNAAAQGETVEDVMLAYRVAACRGVIVSKLDEAVKLGPALDALIRHKAKVVGVTNGQRVPEDWHRLSAQALVQRALRGGGGAPWRLDLGEVSLVFASTFAGTDAGTDGGTASAGHAGSISAGHAGSISTGHAGSAPLGAAAMHA